MTADQTNSILRFSQRLTQLNKAKLDVEYEVMNLRAKGLLPSAEGALPQIVTVDETGNINGDTNLPAAAYVQAVGAVGAVVGTLEANDNAVENAILAFQR